MDEKYKVPLANPSAIQKYSRLKHSDDIDDAFWLAEMWRLGILPRAISTLRQRAPYAIYFGSEAIW